ncbi:MAG: hypothetical protein LBG67_00475, partial [Campylobacteraceae bacterium]|nr:hypothetical protein [Campylobacteraceae bacterium]
MGGFMSIIQGVVREIETISKTSGSIKTNWSGMTSGKIKTDTETKVLVDDKYVVLKNKDIFFSVGDYIIIVGQVGRNALSA